MAVFAVIAPEFNEQLDKAVKSAFLDHYFRIAPGQYLVSGERLTASQVLGKLELTNGTRGRAIILRVASYTGWHNKDIWEWIIAQSAPPPPPVPDTTSDANE